MTAHRDRGWDGDADAFGVGGAILLGDLLLSWTDEMVRSSDLPADRVLAGLPYLDLMRTEVAAGQYLDLVSQVEGSGSEEQALRVVRYKAAKYTVERPLHLGGALAGAGPGLLQAYTAYGLPVGEAFQLRDDVLGVFGDPAATGKPAGDDLREGKRTVLVARTLAAASPSQEAAFRRRFAAADLGAADLELLRDLIVETGALAAVETLIDERVDRADAALARAPLDAEARSALAELAYAATHREL